MTSKPSVTGGACIIASVCVGAGMLGLPSAGAGAWTSWSSLAIILTMIANSTSKCDTRLCRLTVLFEYLDRLPESETFPRS